MCYDLRTHAGLRTGKTSALHKHVVITDMREVGNACCALITHAGSHTLAYV